MSGRLVAREDDRPPSPSKPSISTSSWLSVCSRSSLPWPTPAPRLRPAASSSSMKTIAGAAARALAKRSRMRAAPTPTSDSTNSAPETEKKAACGLARGRAGEQRLAGAGRADEQHALRRAARRARGSGRAREQVAELLAARRRRRPRPRRRRTTGRPAARGRAWGACPPSGRTPPIPPASACWLMRMNRAKREARIRIGSSNCTIRRLACLPLCGSIDDRAPLRRSVVSSWSSSAPLAG